MLARPLRRSLTLLAIAVATCGTSGCFLKALSGIAAEIDGTLIVNADTDTMTTVCVDEGAPGGFIECTYVLRDPSGDFEITSTATLLSEFGLFGAVVDPLILQIPDSARAITATYDDGAGHAGPLDVRSGFKAIPVDIDRHLYAEHRQQFAILELPPGLAYENVDFAFRINFTLPITTLTPVPVKAILTTRFDGAFGGGDYQYYSPMLPCTTDMAEVASIAIPGGVGDPLPIEISNPPQGCNNEVYRYIGFGALQCDFDTDLDVDRDDLRIQANVRNTPALPGDRLDVDRDGRITLNDVRRCALQCTTPQCQAQGAQMLAALETEDEA